LTILGLDGSSVSGSAALWRDGALVAQSYLRCGLTHSETLMPQVERLLSLTGLPLSQLDCVAVTRGPGSFTGLRIAASCAKGLAYAASLPCCGVSTLETLAMNLRHADCRIAAVLDARRGQVYAAWFDAQDGVLTRLSEDEAVPAEALREKILPNRTVLVGDGAELCYTVLGADKTLRLAPEALRYVSAFQAAELAAARRDEWQDPAGLLPVYLRQPQAVREREEKSHGADRS
jgi:tRNA threonylcarbamoyladenosine biosynthesis protein TsaB